MELDLTKSRFNLAKKAMVMEKKYQLKAFVKQMSIVTFELHFMMLIMQIFFLTFGKLPYIIS